ncbi:MAG: hypothetical protein R3Y36_05585, partial [Spirochaetales bacterium]
MEKVKDFTSNEQTGKRHSPFIDTWKRMKRNKFAMVGLVIICLLIFCAIFADYIAPYSYDAQNLKERFLSPSWEHPFGTDNF